MTAATDTDIQQIKDLITAGQLATQQQIVELVANSQKQITELTLELRAGFADMDKRIEIGFAQIDTKLAEVKGDIKTIDAKLEEKTKNLEERIGRWEGATTRLSIAILTGLLLTFAKFLFFGKLN